jgi:hypothetical protein
MGKFTTISSDDIKTSRSFLNQLVDVVQEDISGSTTRMKYQVFVTGGVGPGVTSSLFHTVYDQDFTLQTANPIFDMTVGLNRDYVSKGMQAKGETDSTVYAMGTLPTEDSYGKLSFEQNSLMMREKIGIYQQFAQLLLNNASSQFNAPFNPPADDTTAPVNNAMFVCYKRLFARDAIKRETYAMKMFSSASYVPTLGSVTVIDSDGDGTDDYAYADGTTTQLGDLAVAVPAGWYAGATIASHANQTDADAAFVEDTEAAYTNLDETSANGVKIFTDIGSSNTKYDSYGGKVGNIVDSSNTANVVGLMFYDHGIAVYDIEKISDGTQFVSGTISSVSAEATDSAAGIATPGLSLDGFTIIGADGSPSTAGPANTNQNATFVPDLMYSGSMDNILDHLGSCRFGSTSQSAMTFQNVTNINSTLYFCKARADEFNYSSNPTFTDDDGRIVVIDEGVDAGTQNSFTFVTSVGLYDGNNNLLAVAKLSRPVEKNNEKDLTFRVRLDFSRRSTNIRLNHKRN